MRRRSSSKSSSKISSTQIQQQTNLSKDSQYSSSLRQPSKASSRGTGSTKSSKTSSKSSKRTLSSEESKKTVLDEEEVELVEVAVETDEARRKRELVEFLEDLGNSVEFQEFLEEKQRKKDEAKKKVVVEEELQEIVVGGEEKFPLTQKSILERELEEHYTRLLMNKINRRKKRYQEESIARIRDIIAFTKSSFYCHANERKMERQNQLDEALEVLEDRLQTTIPDVHLVRDKINARFLCSNRIRRFQRQQQKQRQIAIIRKLLYEYERQRQLDEAANKKYVYRARKREKVIPDMEVVGCGIQLPAEEPPEETKQMEGETELEEEETITETPVVVKEKKGKKEKKIKEAKPKKVKEKKSKENKLSADDAQKFKLPEIPNVNERNKVIPSDALKMGDLIRDLPELEQIEHEQHTYKKALTKEYRPKAAQDTLTVVKPKELCFKGFKNCTIYKKRLTILNSANYTKKYRLYTIDLLETQLIRVDSFGIQKLAPGMSFQTNVTFAPLNQHEYFRTLIVFLAYYTDTGEEFQFSVPVVCVPLYSAIVITPEEVCFETVPIWVAKTRSKYEKFRRFKLKNCGTRTSFIVIRKIRDPLQIEEETEDENLVECVENVFNYFELEHYVLELPPESQRSLKVYFKNADHIGFYYERYSVDIYEKIDDSNEKFLGCQEIALTAETTGNYISATPETLDYAFCVLNTVYQLPISLKNNDKLPHCLALRFPKRLANNLRASATNVIVQPHQKIIVYIKLIPRSDTIQDNQYYDEDLNLLKFPIYVYVSEKTAANVPPIKIELFAALYQPLPLILTPIRRSEGSSSDNLLFALVLGDCTTRETLCGKIAITNESHVTHHYGFLNLPECLTIMPNYGFGVVKPMQTVILTILFSPRFEDIPEVELIPMKTCYSFNFNIAVDTIKNLGGIKEFKNHKVLVQLLRTMEREIEFDSEPPVFHEIYRLHYLLIKNQYEMLKALVEPEEVEMPVAAEEEVVKESVSTKFVDSDPSKSTLPSSGRRSTSQEGSKQTLRSVRRQSKSQQSVSSQSHCTSSSLVERDYYHYFGLPSPTAKEEESAVKVADEEELENTTEEQECTIPSTVKNFLHFLEQSQNKLLIEATIVNPLCELSHQFLAFPTTPCGSYSMMTLELKALSNPFELQCDCGYLKKKYPELFVPIDYEAVFEIVNTGSQFEIEPTYGVIKSGESKKLTVIARPEIPADIVEDQAKVIKAEEVRKKLMEARLEAMMNAKQKKKGKEKKEEKKQKKGKKEKKVVEKVVQDSEDEVEVADNLVVLNYMDYFPAEMYIWRSLEPYSIESGFVCTIRYHNQDIDRKEEKLLLKTTCKVVRPDFITNSKTQHLSFGTVAINTTAKQYISIQNITNKPIRPTLTLLQPTGPFYCPDSKKYTLGPEASFNLSIEFTPFHEDEVVQYAEIRAGKTIHPLKISGRGIGVQLRINPEFLVYRLVAQRGGKTLLTLELDNTSDVKLAIKLVKTHELQGAMVKLEKPKVEKEGKTKAGKKPPPKKEKDKKDKKTKHSMELTEDEEYSIKTLFKPRNLEKSFFYAFDPDVTLEPKSKTNVKLRFGVPVTPEQLEEEKKGKKKKAKQEIKATSDEEEIEPDDEGPKQYYLAKYNVLLGTQICRDLIIIASFK